MKPKEIIETIFMQPAFFALVLPVSLLAGLYLLWSSSFMWHPHGDRGEACESREIAGSKFKVKITAYHEIGGYFQGAYHVCESAPVNSDNWIEFTSFHVDDPIPISRENMRMVNDNTAYAFSSGKLVVTTDGGQTWPAWIPVIASPNGESVSWWIEEVDIQADGTGRTRLRRYAPEQEKTISLELHTKDYGLQWSAPQECQSLAFARTQKEEDDNGRPNDLVRSSGVEAHIEESR